MAGFYGCLKIPDDPTMAASLREVSAKLEALEASDEGKKKSKFKAFKNFFGKKKKKEPEGTQRRSRSLKPSSSSSSINSSLNLVQEVQQPMFRVRRSMSKSLSHESIFILESEPEIPGRKLYPSPELQSGRSLERSVSRTLSITSSVHRSVSGSLLAVMPHYVQRSGIWIGGSKITEIPPLRARHFNIDPPLTQSDTISKDFEEIYSDDESPETPKKKYFTPMSTVKKSSFEPPSIPIRAQSLTTFATITSPSSPQLSISFSTPATTQGCLDSSAARHKMALNPRKQKKYLQATMKPKQEEPGLPLVSEEKTKPKAVTQRKLKDTEGPSSQEQRIKTEIYKTTDQAANADAAESQGHSLSAAYGKRRGKKEASVSEKNECGSKGWSFIQPSRGLSLGNRAGYPSADKIARDSPFCRLSLETQVMKQPRAPQVENITPQELLSDENDTRRRMAGLDFKTRKESISYIRPNDVKESMASGPSQYLEDGASGTKKSDDITSLSSMVENPSTSQEDTMFSVTGEAQVHMDPSHIQSEEEDASSFDSKSDQFEMESAQDSSTICKEMPSGNVIQAFPASVSDMASALTEGGISVERMPPRSLSQSLGKPEAEGIFLDSDSISEVESGSDQQLTPGYVFQSSSKPKDEELLSNLERASLEKGSGSEQEPDPKYSFQLVKSKDDQEAFPDSNSFVGNLCISHEQLASRCVSQALEEPEDKVPTESNTNSAKYSNPNDWSSSEGDMPPRHPFPVLERPTAQQEISVSKNTLQEKSVVSMEQTPPRHHPQPSVKPSVQQQLSSDSANAFSEWVSTPPMNFFHPWLSPKSEEQASAGQASIAPEWGIFMEPLPPRVHSRRLVRNKIEQPISSPEIATGITSTELKPSRNNSQRPVKPIAKQEISAGPESKAVKGSISMEPPSPNILTQPMMNPKVEQNVFLGSEGVNKIILVELALPDCSTNPQDERIFSENTASNKDIFVEPLYPNYPSQPLVKLNFQPQTISSDPGSACTEWSHPVEPPRHTKGSWVITSFEQPSASPEGTAVEWGNPREPLPPKMPSQSLRRPVAKQEVSGLMSAPKEWSGLVQLKPLQPWESPKFEQQTYEGPETLPPRKPSQHQMKSVVKQPTSAGPKSVAIEGDISTELLPPRHWSIVRHKIQKMMPTSENAAVGCISKRPLPMEYPTHSSKPNIQKISSYTENPAVEENMSKKSLHNKCPSQSFVKFMAQHVFSESPNMEEQVYVDPLSSNQPSKYLLRPTVEHQIFSGCESADFEGDISSKLLPMKCPSQSSGRPEDPQGVFSYSENVPVKCSNPQEQLPPGYLFQAWGKLKYGQELSSVSESSLKERKSSEEQLPSKCPIQVEDGAELQPQISSTGSVSVPVERSSAENRLPARHPFQAFSEPQYKPQVYSSFTSAAAKGAIFESNPSSWYLPRGPASPGRTRGHSQDSQDLFKDTSTPATKSVRFALAPAWPPTTSGDTYSKEDVFKSSDKDDCSNLSTSEADVENIFGVRLKRIPSSQKYRSDEQNNSTTLPSHSLGPVLSSTDREPQIRSASQGLLGITKNLTTIPDVAEKEKSKPKSDSMPKKKPDDKIPGKAPGKQSGYATSEPSWITMIKQKQKNSPNQVPAEELKTNNKAGAKADTKVPTYERADLAEQSQQREISTPNVNRQQKKEQIKIHDSTKAGYENEKIIQMPTMKKETRQSSAHPAMFEEPDEPIWFSMAKKKAKAWSQITETMQ